MLNIAPALYGQSEKYIHLWLYVFNQLSKGENAIAVASLIHEINVTRQSMYEILNRGVRVFGEHGLTISLHRKHSTDNMIVFNVGELINQSIQTATKVKASKEDKPKRSKSINDQQSLAVNAVVTYLNQVSGKQYRTDNESTIRLILARLNKGFTVEQFYYVIDVKAAHWMNTDMEKYIRPETLFGNKFESYLNETFTTNKPNDTIRNAEESINRDW